MNQSTQGLCPQFSFDQATNHIPNPGFNYDAAGDLLWDGVSNCEYDAEGRVKYSASPGPWQCPGYNALGQRVQDYQGAGTDGSTLTYPVDISGRRVGTWNQWPSHNWTGWNVYWSQIAGQRLNMGGASAFIDHSDAVGSTTMETDPSGAVVWDVTHYPWGRVFQEQGTRQSEVVMGLDWQVNDPVIPSATREYNFRVYRWMTPDPGGVKVVKLDNPQTWNMYAYVGNNPTSRNDPSGLYTVECGSDDKRCSKAAQRFENQRLKDLASKHADVRSAAAAWGGPTDKNGITVTFKTQKALESENGAGTQAAVTPGQTTGHQPDIQAEFSESLRGASLRRTIAHEGTHVGDDLSFLNSYNPATGRFDSNSNFTHYMTGFNAFVVGAEVKKYSNLSCGGTPCSFGPRDLITIDRYLNTTPAYIRSNDILVFSPIDFPQ